MEARRNPFAPGAGMPPPQLAGRDDVRERASVALDRVRDGRAARSFIFYGLRGVGKTVLLSAIFNQATDDGFVAVMLEAPEGRSLPAVLGPALRTSLLRLDRIKRATTAVTRALRALAGFAKLKVRYADLEFGLDIEPEPGLADSGSLDTDLGDLLVAIGEAARERDTAFVLGIDELQYVAEPELAALIAALHRVAQRQLPFTLIGAGLPQLLGQMGDAKSYAERLFEFVPLGPLDDAAARDAIRLPIQRESAAIEDDALELIITETQGYPYFLQEWGKHAWRVSAKSPINRADVVEAHELAIAELDASFFRVRFDRLTPKEKRYLRAMATLGPGPHRSGEIAAKLNGTVTGYASTRNSLILKGMLYSPSHGDTAFTVPLFDAFMRRVMQEG